jgi:exonuclease III
MDCNRRPKHAKKTKGDINGIATWNVQTLLKPGRMQEIADQIKSSQIKVLALQEIRRKGYGQIRNKEYIMYYSCDPDKAGQNDKGFVIQKDLEKNIMSFEPVTNRLCKLRLRGKFHNIKIINGHAPTKDKEEEEKELFYTQYQKSTDKAPRKDILVILRDFNSKISKEKAYNKVCRQHTLHDNTNNNGEFLCNFAIENNLIVAIPNFRIKGFVEVSGSL